MVSLVCLPSTHLSTNHSTAVQSCNVMVERCMEGQNFCRTRIQKSDREKVEGLGCRQFSQNCVQILSVDLILGSGNHQIYFSDINLSVIGEYKKQFSDINIGFSGHELGFIPTLGAVAIGAKGGLISEIIFNFCPVLKQD